VRALSVQSLFPKDEKLEIRMEKDESLKIIRQIHGLPKTCHLCHSGKVVQKTQPKNLGVPHSLAEVFVLGIHPVQNSSEAKQGRLKYLISLCFCVSKGELKDGVIKSTKPIFDHSTYNRLHIAG